MDYLAEQLRVEPTRIPWLRRNLGLHDLRALPALVCALRRAQPHIVHTHAAKAGALGRLAALLAWRGARRPVLVHTYHGHSLSAYFSARRNAAFTAVERFLATRTDRLIAVSEQVRDDLVALGVAPSAKFEIVRVGFDLSGFVVDGTERSERRRALRAELGIPLQARVVTLVSRLVPIKRVDRFLRIANRLRDEPDVRFLIVGDGELRAELRALEEARTLGDRLVWAGFRRDMADVYFASDVVVQTSENEGTPVALIEAQAAAVPVVSTRVGGVASVLLDGVSGHVAAADAEAELSDAVPRILADARLATDMGSTGRRHVLDNFSLERLLTDVDLLYRRLLDGEHVQ